MDPAQIIDSILRILSSERDPEPQVVEQLNRELSVALTPVNARLRRCDKLLHDGQRSQAIELCEVEPQLLDAVALLDFPERSVWDDYVGQFFFTLAPTLLVDVAAELNEAYTSQMSLQGVLDQFRLHSLARSPLAVRTVILRQLVDRDPNNVPWQHDLQAYEQSRLSEIKTEVDAAASRKNVTVVAEVERELAETPWVSGRPSKLLDYVAKTHNALRRVVASEQLEELAQKLTTAFAAFDIETARRHRDRWNALSNVVSLETTDPLYELASPALHWVAENDRRDSEEHDTLQSLADLDAAIDSGASRLELERLHRQATKAGQDLPAGMKNRYEARIDYLETMARRKNLVVVLSVVLACAASAVGVGAYYQHSQRVQEKAGRVTALQEHLQSGNLTAARDDAQKCEEDSASVFQSAEYQTLVAELSVAETNEQDRQLHLESTLETARETGLKSPSWGNLEAALAKLTEAEKIAETRPGELARVKRMENELRKELRRLQEAVDMKYQTELQSLVSTLDTLDVGQETAVLQTLQQARTLRTRERVSSELFSDLDLLVTRLDAMSKTASEIREDEKLFEGVTRSVGDTRSFTSAMEIYLQRFPPPTRPHSEPIRRTLEEGRNVWPAIIRWNGFCGTWRSTDPYNTPAGKAAQFASHARALKTEYTAFPFHEEFLRVAAHMEAVGKQAGSDNEGLFAPVVALLNNPLYNKIYAVRKKSGEIYYCSKPPLFEKGKYTIDYFIDTGLSKKKIEILTLDSIENDATMADHHWDAPQWKLAREIIPLLDKLTPQTWEGNVEQALKRVMSDKAIDPILKMQLATEILQTASEGSLVIGAVFAESLQIMTGKVEQLRGNWIDPTNADGRRIRRLATEALISLDLDQQYQELKQSQKSLGDKTWNVEYRWVGWIVKDYREKWECRFKSPLSAKDNGNLVTIRAVDASHWQFEEVASVRDGQSILAKEGSGIQEGRPVFFVETRQTDQSTSSILSPVREFQTVGIPESIE